MAVEGERCRRAPLLEKPPDSYLGLVLRRRWNATKEGNPPTSDLTVLKGKSGTVVQTTKITGKGKGKGQKTGQVVHGHKVVTASDGTFVIDFRGGLKPTGATTSEVNGRFVLKKGTGAYKGLHGNGKIHATLDSSSGAITAVYTGKAHVQNKT